MSRKARVKSETGLYHVMLRGNNKQIIFLQTEDYQKFISILRECKLVDNFGLYAYCLMPNHVHLIIRTTDQPIGEVMRRIGSRFATWYNIRHERVGHLFQNRYKSEPINNDSYLCTVLRYIHLNPVKAYLCDEPGEYPYSSYRDYFDPHSIIDSDYFRNFFGEQEFYKFHQIECDEKCMDIEEASCTHVTNEAAEAIILSITGCSNAKAFLELPRMQQAKYIQEIASHSVSLRQISRLTGLSTYKVQSRAKLYEKTEA